MTLSRVGNNFPNGYAHPDMHSKKVLVPFYEEALSPKITNGDYLEELSKGYGETIYVIKRPAVKVTDRSLNAIRNWTEVVDERTSFTLSYNKGVDIKQSKLEKARDIVSMLDECKAQIVEEMKIAVDTTVVQTAHLSATTAYDSTSAWSTKGNPSKDIALCRAYLKKLKTPATDMFLLLDNVSCSYLLQEETLWADRSGDSKSPMRTGEVGTLLGGMTVYESSLVPYDGTGAGTNGNQYIGMMGHRSAITLAVVLKDFEFFPQLEQYVNSEGLSGNIVYGMGVVRPDALASFRPLWS